MSWWRRVFHPPQPKLPTAVEVMREEVTNSKLVHRARRESLLELLDKIEIERDLSDALTHRERKR